jgi:putative phosphoesterase
MKIMVASDIHGSAFYAEKMSKRFLEEKADTLLLLGDLLYHGPRNDLPKDYNPKEVINILNGLKKDIIAVRGNCDSEVDQMVLEFPILADYALILLGNKRIYATHGHRINKENMIYKSEDTILLHGHTHIPVCEECDGFIYMNPGSVSIPKEESKHGYMVLEKDVAMWKDMDGEILWKYTL